MSAAAQTEALSRVARFPAFQARRPGCFRHPENREDRTQRGRGLNAGVQAGRFHPRQAQPRAGAGNRCDPVAATLNQPHAKPRAGTPRCRLPNLQTNCLLILHNFFQSVSLRPGLMAVPPSELVTPGPVMGVRIIRKPESRTVGENGDVVSGNPRTPKSFPRGSGQDAPAAIDQGIAYIRGFARAIPAYMINLPADGVFQRIPSWGTPVVSA